MSEHEGREARAVYDHEVDDPRLTGRRRAVADWGVGEELFDRMPRRRFRSGDAHRRDVHRTGRFEPADPRGRAPERDEEARPEPRSRAEQARREPRARDEAARPERRSRAEQARREPRVRDEATRPERRGRAAEAPREWVGEAREEPRARAEEARPEPRALVEEPPAITPIDPVAPPEPLPGLDDTARPPEGRRTVVIRGRGAEPAWTPRRRPPRTVGERLGPRPDRLAAWAVALGMLLILIAILTAHG